MEPDRDFNARQLWAQLPKEARWQVIKNARKQEPIADQRTAKIALGWAWAILGRPETRRKVNKFAITADLIGNLMVPEGNGTFQRVDIFDGARHHDLNIVVRRVARRVEQANYRPAIDDARAD
jgi:hypothetical protein